MSLNKKEIYRYLQNELWAYLLNQAELEIKYDEEGKQWIFSDEGIGIDYGQGETPQEALNDYIQSTKERVLIEQDYIRDELN